MSDLSWRYLESVNRDALTTLAAGRRHRLQNKAQPRFGLTAEEIERSTRIAMRLADTSRSQAKDRGGADSIESAKRYCEWLM